MFSFFFFSVFHISVIHDINIYFTGNINLDHLVKVVLTQFFYCKVIFPIVINKCFVKQYLGIM